MKGFVEILKRVYDEMAKRKSTILVLSCVVVFITTYALILPAMTLEKDRATKLGGISLRETRIENSDAAENADRSDNENSEIPEEASDISHEQAREQRTEAGDVGADDGDKTDGGAATLPDGEDAKDKNDAGSGRTGDKSTDTSAKNDAASAPQGDPLKFEGEGFNVAIDDRNQVLPEDTSLNVEAIDPDADARKYDKLSREAIKAIREDKGSEGVSISFAYFYDLKLQTGSGEIEPDDAVGVRIGYDRELAKLHRIKDAENVHIVHFAEDKVTGKTEPTVLEKEAVEVTVENKKMTEAAFEADSFSVFAVVYTVDFAYEVDGERFETSIEGGSGVTLSSLVRALGVIRDDPATDYDEVDAFISEVESVEFSDPELVWTGKADGDTTIGQLKDANGLEVNYSGELTDEQIEAINAQKVKVGDWAMISLQPFTSEETLTVTMKNGDVFTVGVTDAQPIANAEASTIDVNKSYLIVYEAGGIYYLLKNDGSVDSTKTPANSNNFEDLNSTYAWTFSHVFKEKDIDTNLDNNYFLIRPIDNKSKTLTLNYETTNTNPLVQDGNNNTGVIPASGGGFTLQGYHNVGSEEHPRYIHLGFDNGAFKGIDGTGVTVHIYEMDSLPAYDYTVRSDDETRGTVTVQGGTQRTEPSGTHYYDATSDSAKKNAGTITAVPVNHKNNNATDPSKRNENKWLFDHWEQDGVPLDRQQYGQTINAGALPIPFNGSNLTAYFRQNPNYEVPDSEKEPSSFEDMSNWLTNLENKSVPLDKDSTTKTAEVYDYENRIYRVDITSKANFKTFDGNVDMAFCLDVSNSMKFPSKLVKADTYYNNNTNPIPIYQINNSGSYGGRNYDNRNWLDTSRGYNNPYYLIADASGTATVFRLYYQGGNWKAQDASRTSETDKVFVIGSAEGLPTNYGQDNNHPFSVGDNDNTTYMIYNAGDSGRDRFYYLNNSFSGATDDLTKLRDLLNVAGAQSPAVRVAYNTFNKNLGSRQNFQSVSKLTVAFQQSAGGGTRPDQAFNDARSFNWQGKSRYVVLITDGAPQGIRDGENNTLTNNQIRDIVKNAAKDLKDEDDVKFITIGLSMNDVTEGKKLLYDLADADKNGDKMFYMAESASDLPNILRQIMNTVMEEAIVYSDVTDTINEAFYPVDKASGLPLKAGDKITIEGIKTTDNNEAAGIVQADGKTIKWVNQPIDQLNGWHGTVYVKAKEDLIGGNAVKTNDAAKIEATKYRVGGKDYSFDASLVNSKLKSLKVNFESPRVNVNELTFPNADTEWTVYLGENVDPKQQIRKLYEGIDVIQVVNKDGSLHYPISPNSISDERGGETTGTPASFKVADTILELIKSDNVLSAKYIKNNQLDWDAFLTDILKPGGVTVPYHPYGIEGEDSNIVITLSKDVKEHEEQDIVGMSPHTTTVVGEDVEKYVLTVKYNPDYNHVLPAGQGGQNENAPDFHTGTYGTMYQGHAAGRETSTDTHVINVYKKTLDVLKTDSSASPSPLANAQFKLYVKDNINGAEVEGLSGKYSEVATARSGSDGIAHLDSQSEDILVAGTTYYLVETEAPANYQKDNTVYAVEIQKEEGKYTSGEWVYEEDDKITRYSTGTPTQDPYNWDQGSRIMVNGKPATAVTKGSAEGQTVEVADGSYISNENVISFRHTIRNKENKITITVNKTWENVESKPENIRFELYRVSEKGHKWGAPTIINSTCAEAGVEEYTCLICGEKETHVIEAKDHTPGEAHIENEIAPTCTEMGGYDTVVRCKVCNAIITSEHTSIDAIGHDWGEWEVTTPAEPGKAGVETRVCKHDITHTETRPIAPLSTQTTITYRTYRDFWGLGYLEQTITTDQTYEIGSSVTLSWSSFVRYDVEAYKDANPVISQGSYIPGNGFEFNDGDALNVQRTQTGNGWNTTYNYSVTVTVTKDMTLDLVSSLWDYYPQNISITQNRSRNIQSLNAANILTRKAGLQRVTNSSSEEKMTSEELAIYLDGVKSKDQASCLETYKELAGTYTITPDNVGHWAWSSDDLPKYNENGKEYTYYVKEIDPSTGYETTYLGQTTGLHDGDSVTINNKLQKGSLEITKKVLYNGHEASTDAEKGKVNGSYTFVVKKEGVEITGSPFTINVTNGISNSILIPDLEEGEYTIQETGSGNLILTGATGGKSVNGSNVVTATVTPGKTTAADLLSTAKAEFTNNYTEYEVVIVKVDTGNTDLRLGGAKFDLYPENAVVNGELVDGAIPIRQNLVSSSTDEDKGKVSLGQLAAGTYYLFETSPPAGYESMEGPVRITVSNSSVSLMQGETQRNATVSQGKAELMVTNTAGVELPHTGGIGTTLFYIFGSVLVLGSAVVLISRKRLRKN